ncbi:hypothetical protein [Actinophytocola sp.]|uniref:hypothetical protein n=1 Tax=Actinophytocola sp. TaxID=1872138 RepID=UPI002ED08B66
MAPTRLARRDTVARPARREERGSAAAQWEACAARGTWLSGGTAARPARCAERGSAAARRACDMV